MQFCTCLGHLGFYPEFYLLPNYPGKNCPAVVPTNTGYLSSADEQKTVKVELHRNRLPEKHRYSKHFFYFFIQVTVLCFFKFYSSFFIFKNVKAKYEYARIQCGTLVEKDFFIISDLLHEFPYCKIFCLLKSADLYILIFVTIWQATVCELDNSCTWWQILATFFHQKFTNIVKFLSMFLTFLADRTNGRAYATLLCCVRLSLSVTLCIVAKRCILEKKLLLTIWQPVGSRTWEIDWYQNKWPWFLFRGHMKVTSTIALH